MSAAIAFERVSKYFKLDIDRPRSFQERFVGLFRRQPHNSQHDFWALRHVSFEIQPGETVGLIGENGAGKSTALKLMARILSPTSGQVQVRGRVSAMLELGAGFHPDLTGRENVFLNGSLMGLSRAQIKRSLDDIIAFAEIDRFIDVPVRNYSSGMYVRLAFAVAVHTRPEILLVDEVLAVGDQNFQHKCMERIMAMKRQGVTICFVSHDLDAVRRLCSRAIWLEDGIIQAEGKADDTVSAYLRRAAAEEEARWKAEHAQDTLAPSQEAESAPPGAGTTAPEEKEQVEIKQRWGTGEVKVVDVSFLDEAGEACGIFHAGRPWTVRLRYRSQQRIEMPVFGLALHRDDGVHICGPNTRFANLDIPFVEGTGEIVYQVDQLPLMEGTYLLSVSAHDQSDAVMYDYHDRLYTFKVRQVGQGERYGLVSLGGKWTWRDGGSVE
ncbi:MAG: ABC transporter ATP-binding protein [Thermoflexales bacterium]|nr:ABC transporter ATP-binding protein [Thermoflexales bacterium]